MNNGHQGNAGQGGSPEPSKSTIETIPDLIATPPPSRDHLTQLVFPSPERNEKSQSGGSGQSF